MKLFIIQLEIGGIPEKPEITKDPIEAVTIFIATAKRNGMWESEENSDDILSSDYWSVNDGYNKTLRCWPFEIDSIIDPSVQSVLAEHEAQESVMAEHGGYWQNHPEKDDDDWAQEVLAGNTRLSYWDWVCKTTGVYES